MKAYNLYQEQYSAEKKKATNVFRNVNTNGDNFNQHKTTDI